MRRRTLSFLALVILILALVAACGGGGGGTSPTAPAGGAPAAPEGEAPEGEGTEGEAPEGEAPEGEGAAGETPAAEAPEGEAPEGEAPEGEGEAPAGEAAAGMMTVGCGQQATWVRNFNPFVGDFRFPTVNGIYEPLMIYNTLKGELTPWLATEYEWSEDNLSLTFTIREGVQWSDGEPFTAGDVAFTFNLFKENPGLQGAGLQAMSADTGYVESVEAPDDTTVVFTFNTVFTPGLYDIASQNIVPEHIWSEVEDPVTFTNENPVGTGPFTEVLTFQNQIYEIGKNPNYWQEGKPAIAGIRCPAYPSNDAVNLATVNGEIDWLGGFIPDIEQTYVSKDPENFGYWFPPTGATVMLYLNTTKAPFDDVNVRKAISQCINRDQIVTVAMYDYTKPADVTGLSDAYPNFKVSDPASLGDWATMNVEAANQLLDEAGLERGDGGTRQLPDGTPLEYEINVVSGWSDWVSAVQIIAQNLEECGIAATVKAYDFSAWFDRVQNGEFDISIGWSSGGATPYNYYRDQMSQRSFKPVGEAAGANWHRYVSEQGDELLNQLAATSDPEEQQAIAEQLQQVFAEEAPAVPLFPGPMWYEYNTRRFTGFPNEDNPYSVGSPFSGGTPEQLIVMTTVEPK